MNDKQIFEKAVKIIYRLNESGHPKLAALTAERYYKRWEFLIKEASV